MVLDISRNRTLQDTQEEFNKAYPFLRIEFYRNTEPGFARRHLPNSTLLASAGLKKTGELEIYDSITVGEVENTFREKFGLHVQVSRRSGNLWLETTITDNWTLKQQNDHGREISEHSHNNSTLKNKGVDFD